MYDPILGKNENRRKKAKELGNLEKGDGVKYKGRGFVQITGKTNYIKFSNELSIDFVTNPELTLQWENSFKIMLIGMYKGLFTGEKLTDYIFLDSSKKDYYNARKIINGLNEAETIKKYAEEFEKCLIESM
jgi:predicted chitinase